MNLNSDYRDLLSELVTSQIEFLVIGGYAVMLYSEPRYTKDIDTLTSIPGVDFDEAWQNRNEVKIDDLIIPFISKEDLIEAKKASGRASDLADLESLTSPKK